MKEKYQWLIEHLEKEFPDSRIVLMEKDWGTSLAVGMQHEDRRHGVCVEEWRCRPEPGQRCESHDPLYDDNGDLTPGDNVRHEKFSLNELPEDGKQEQVQSIMETFRKALYE